jgi:2-methylfumaryl-CoA isomerase
MLNLRVIESSAFIAAPLAGLTLAQFGADVIRVEMIGGGIDYGRLPLAPSGRSLYWTGLNKAKRSIAIDLRHAQGRELVRNLVTASGKDAGILLTNIPSPWLAHAELAKDRPDLISCTIEGNPDGSTAVDYTVNCATGYPAATGPGSAATPVNHVLPAWDIACAYQAALAVLAAVDRRRRSGEGAELRLALSDVAFSTLSHLGVVAEAEVLGQERPAIGNYIYGAFGRDFATADKSRVMIAAISAGQWAALVKACGLTAEVRVLETRLGANFDREADRYAAREAIAGLVEPWVKARSLEVIKTTFDANRVCWGQYRTPRDLIAHDPRLSEDNPIWEYMETQGVGPHLAAGAAVRSLGEVRRPISPAPLIGRHTDEILHEVLGLGSGEIGRLHDQGLVAGPDKDPTAFGGRG